MFHGHIVTPATLNSSIPMNSPQTPAQSLMSMSSPQSMHSMSCTPQSIKSTPGIIKLEEERAGSEEEWKMAWCNWAFSRKRGKLAQFIIRHLQLRDYARWLDAKRGKFEIRDWQTLAKIWYLEKERTSEEMDATSIFKKGLSKAFPNLQEVKHMSIKEGTLYKTRVFEAPKELCDEVYKFVKNPRTPAIPLEQFLVYQGSNPTLLENYHAQTHQFTPAMFPLGPNNNQVFDLNFSHIAKREPAFQQQSHPTAFHHSLSYQQPQQQIRLIPRAVSQHVHPNQIINQSTAYVTQPEYTIHPISQQLLNTGSNMIPSNTVYTVRDPDHVVPGTSFSPESTSYYSQVETEPNNQPYPTHAQCDIEEYVDNMPCKPSPGSDHMTMVPSPHVQGFEENTGSNLYTGSSFTQRSSNGHLDSPLVDQKETEHVHAQIPEHSHILMTDFYDVRVTPVHSPIQGGGDLCLVFSQQDHPVPHGEKFLYFDSAISPHLVAINQDLGYALFTQIPAHPRSETLRIYVILAETRAKIASAEFTYTDASYSPYTIEVLKGLTQNLINNENYKSITGDFSSQFQSSQQQQQQQQQQTPNQFYNHPGYNPMYKMLVLAAGLGLEPLLYVLLQPRTHHNLLLIPSPTGLLPEDYAQKFGHYKISVCLSLVRKQFERTSGVQNDETDEGEVETAKRDTKSTFYPKGDPLGLINRGGTTPIETTQAIMNYLTKLMSPMPTQAQTVPSPPNKSTASPPADRHQLAKTTSEDVTTKKPSSGKQEAPTDPKPYERGQSAPKLGSSGSKSSSSNILGDSGYEPSFESFSRSRDSGDVLVGEITLISGLKYSKKCELGSINSINHHKTDRMLESEAIDLLNQELKGLRMEGKPIVLTARGEFEATLKLEPLQSLHDLQKVCESREVMVTQSEESAFSIVGGNQSGIFVHSVSSPLHSELAEGDHVLSLNGESLELVTGYEAIQKIGSFSSNASLKLTVVQNPYKYADTLSQSDNWDSFYVRAQIENEAIEKGLPHYLYLDKSQVPTKRLGVLMGPRSEPLKVHRDKFCDSELTDTCDGRLKSQTQRTHPAVVQPEDRDSMELSRIHPIDSMCNSHPSIISCRDQEQMWLDTIPTRDTNPSTVTLEVASSKENPYSSRVYKQRT